MRIAVLPGKASIVLVVLLCAASLAARQAPRDYEAMREKMVREIKSDMFQTRAYTGRDELSDDVLKAIGNVERHLFVPEEYLDHSYDNAPLPIGEGQTISQPFIVALMTELLEVDSGSKVLELGTGSGYQAAVLGEIVRDVYTIEIVEPLAERAAALLERLGYANVHVRQGDGTLGWPEEAPFDGIIVTAAGVEIPQPLLEQLKVGGRMVIPVGGRYEAQHLKVVTRNEDGSFSERTTLPVRFVPITGPNR